MQLNITRAMKYNDSKYTLTAPKFVSIGHTAIGLTVGTTTLLCVRRNVVLETTIFDLFLGIDFILQ